MLWMLKYFQILMIIISFQWLLARLTSTYLGLLALSLSGVGGAGAGARAGAARGEGARSRSGSSRRARTGARRDHERSGMIIGLVST